MADMNFQLVLEAIVKGQGALDKLAKSEEQIAQAAKAANAAQAGGAGKIDAAMTRQAQAMQRAATAAKSLGTGAHAAASASTQQAAAAERVATAEQRAAAATKAHATAATQEAKAAAAAAGVHARDARGRHLGGGGGRRFAEEALSQATPYGYVIGAGAAVAGGAAAGVGAYAAYEAGKRAIGEAISREVAFAQVQKKVNLEAGQSWEQIDRQIARVSTTLGKTYQDAAAMFDQGGASGIAGKDLEQFAMLSGKVSTAWDIGTREAALGLAEMRAQTGKTLPQLEIFADKINYLGDISAAAEKDIFNMSQRAMAGMKAAGVGEDQSLALMTGLRSAGMQDEIAARFLNQFSSKMRRATSLTPKAQDAFKELGLSAKSVEQGMQTDAMKTMVDLLERLGKAKNPVKIANDIFGGEWFDEVLRMKDALPEILRVFEALGKGNFMGSMTSAMNIELGTTEAKINQLKASLTDLMATWAKPWAKGTLEPLVEGATNKINEWRQAEERSQASKAAVKPKGLSITDYERIMFERPKEPPKPMFAQIEGTNPHIAQTKGFNAKPILDTSQFARAAELVTSKAGSALEALQKLDGANASVSVDTGGAINSLDALIQKIGAAQQSIKTINSLGAPGAIRTPAEQVGPEHGRIQGGGLGKQGRISTPAMGVVASRGGLRPTHVAHGGDTHIHYGPTFHAASNDGKSWRDQAREHAYELAEIVDRERGRKARLSYRERA